jgi:hypothetical protein
MVMDFAGPNLAPRVVAVLTLYVAIGAQELTKAAEKEVSEKAKGMLAALRAKWAGDEEATHALTRFEKKPERYAPVLEDVLKEKLAEDKELEMMFATLLSEMGPSLRVVRKMKAGPVVQTVRGLGHAGSGSRGGAHRLPGESGTLPRDPE